MGYKSAAGLTNQFVEPDDMAWETSVALLPGYVIFFENIIRLRLGTGRSLVRSAQLLAA
ncbi:hypothetical protein [Hymenobacter coccineus]|uniref:hypothetical protein n=1 Tax=Hymenobacter coccineus TaxID=1908235 RepID=UPI0013011143|nr:hypothetical protein [Hymenobacter coccineus]